jgi:hypothetical protein
VRASVAAMSSLRDRDEAEAVYDRTFFDIVSATGEATGTYRGEIQFPFQAPNYAARVLVRRDDVVVE